MLKNILQQTDLTEAQAEIMEYLFQNKEARASEIARRINRSRTIVYKELDVMVKLGIVLKEENPKQIAVFRADHPSHLKSLLDNRESQLKKDQQLLESYLPDIISNYNLINSQPGIKFYDGVDGLKKIYDEIVNEEKDFYLIRTAYEPVYNDKIAPIVADFIKRRAKRGVKVTAIVPSDVKDPQKDADWLMTRFNVDKKMYTAPVEIDIFGNKVAILSFGEELIGLIVESKQIAQSLKEVFLLATSASKRVGHSTKFS